MKLYRIYNLTYIHTYIHTYTYTYIQESLERMHSELEWRNRLYQQEQVRLRARVEQVCMCTRMYVR